MSALLIFAAGTTAIYWRDLPILLVLISLVYSATRFDDWGQIFREALRWGLRLVGFLFAIVVILYALATFVRHFDQPLATWQTRLARPPAVAAETSAMAEEEPKSDAAPDENSSAHPRSLEFRWQSFFQRTGDPFFVLNRRRRVLFVNSAFEELTGMTLAQARELTCRRHRPATPQDSWKEALEHALCPPAEILDGRSGWTRRLLPATDAGRRCWRVEFLPLCDGAGTLGILGKISVLSAAVASSAAQLSEKLLALRDEVASRHELDSFTDSIPAVRRVADQVRLAGRSAVPVLIVGEPGAGKSWTARAIHQASAARDKTFVALDCARLPVPAVSHVLFEAGDVAGRTGTLYLKEPSRMPRDLQARLAERLADPERVGPRVLAGCAADLEEEVQAGRLLEELRCRLSTLVIALPPLRERVADMPWLVERFLERLNAAPQDTRRITSLSAEAWQLVRAHSWPGNLRELLDVLGQARTHAPSDRIEAGDLPAYLRLSQARTVEPDRPLPLDQLLEQAERRLIELALRKAQGNKTRAAELLSIWRQRLVRRMETLGIGH